MSRQSQGILSGRPENVHNLLCRLQQTSFLSNLRRENGTFTGFAGSLFRPMIGVYTWKDCPDEGHRATESRKIAEDMKDFESP